MKVEVVFTEETIERIAKEATGRIVSNIYEDVSEAIRSNFLPEDVIASICDNIQNQEDDMNIDKVEIVLLQSRGQLFNRVYDKVLEMIPEIINDITEHGTPNE